LDGIGAPPAVAPVPPAHVVHPSHVVQRAPDPLPTAVPAPFAAPPLDAEAGPVAALPVLMPIPAEQAVAMANAAAAAAPEAPAPFDAASASTLKLARHALRERIVGFGQGRGQRTVYEAVFLMLAFSVMVLISAPPLVDVLLAAHGTRR
jgi:hypothetical protein